MGVMMLGCGSDRARDGSVDGGGTAGTGGRVGAGGAVATGGRGATGGAVAAGGTVAAGGRLGTGGRVDAGAGVDAGPGVDAGDKADAGTVKARAAIEITVSPGEGTCNATHGVLAIPQDARTHDALACDLSTGCNPGEFVAVDGEPGTDIRCTITSVGDEYSVRATVSYEQSNLAASGTISKTGGTLAMNHFSVVTGTTLQGECTITIQPNRGAVKPGALWAQFDCPSFIDPGAAGGMSCAAQGMLLFEHCDGI
jgi:hypothetical protein